ncbi:MAG: NAD(P)-binding domain-containing protein, partial [Parachlamydiaceae bacterium]
MTADIGLIGLAVMGQNLVLNMNDHGFTVAVYNRTVSKVDEFMQGPAKGTKIIATHSLKEFASTLKRPRKVMLMVKAGSAVDDFIEALLPFLEKGDIIIDGGNSYYKDDIRHEEELKSSRIHYMDVGVSGGIWGLKVGYCLMIGGEQETYEYLEPIFKTLAPPD